jgi:hypothetical protein
VLKPKRTTKYARWKAKDKRTWIDYIRWLSEQPCVICGSWPVEIAHGATGHMGRNQASSSCLLVPWHHREGPESAHKLGRNFSHHGLNRDELIAKMHEQFGVKSAA